MAAPTPSPGNVSVPHFDVATQGSGIPGELRPYLPAATIGLVVATIAVWGISALASLPALTFAMIRYVAAIYVLLTAGIAWVIAYGMGRVLGRGVLVRQIATRTAATALWLAPATIFLRDRSEWSLLAVGVLAISVARLTGSLQAPARAENFEPPSTSFRLIHSAIPVVELAPTLIAVLLIEGALVATLAARARLAALLVAVGAWLCVRQYNQHSTPDLSRKPRPALRVTMASALMVLALLPHLLLPGRGAGHGGFVPAGGREWSLIGAIKMLLGFRPGTEGIPKGTGETAGTNNDRGNSNPQVEGTPFPGVVLFPESSRRVTTLVAPPPVLAGENDFFGTRHDKPLTIPFSGVYWIMRRPDGPPPDTSLIRRGNPARDGFVSNDFRPLWMEAHQMLGTSIHLNCCAAMRVELTDDDYVSNQVTLELLLSDSQRHAKEALGMQRVALGGPWQRPQHRVLTFTIPRTMRLQKFDEITVRFWLGPRHTYRSARISLDQFVLVPLGR